MINKNAIDKMLEMPDDRLMSMIKIILGTSGIDVGKKKFDEKTVRKIRALLREVTDSDIERIMYLVETYKNGD